MNMNRREPETIRLYTEEEVMQIIARKIKRKLHHMKETIMMALGLFLLSFIPIFGMIVHWVIFGY